MPWLRSLNNYFRQMFLIDAKSNRNFAGETRHGVLCAIFFANCKCVWSHPRHNYSFHLLAWFLVNRPSWGVIWPVDWQAQLGWLWEEETILRIILIFGADKNVVTPSGVEADSIILTRSFSEWVSTETWYPSSTLSETTVTEKENKQTEKDPTI